MRGNGWAAIAIGAGLMMGMARPSAAQGPLPPGAELERLSRRMAEATRDLAEDIFSHAAQIPRGGILARDARELERSTADWYASLRGSVDPYQVRRSYSAIDAGWHRLRGRLGTPGAATPAMVDEIARVEQVNAQIHQALHLNGYPPNFQVDSTAPTGQDELARLSYALAQRGEELASMVQREYARSPHGPALINDATVIARMTDAFHDGLRNPALAGQPEFARAAFFQILQKSNGLGIALSDNGMSPRMAATWTAYTSVHNLTRANLGLNAPNSGGLPPQDPGFGDFNFDQRGIPYAPPQQGSIVQAAQQLDQQIEELVVNFGPTVQVVPEGREMFDEMNRLRDEIREFRQRVARESDPAKLAYEFREVDATCHRLSRHFGRVAKGRTGPNIQRVQQLAQTCEQIHRTLGMPGYPPTFGPYDDVR